MFASPGETAFFIGSLPIYYYGILMGLSLLVGIFMSWFIAKKFYPELESDVIFDIAPVIIISGILGARIYYCLLAHDYYFENPIEVLQIWQGGLSIHGGIIGGLLGGLIYAQRHKLPKLQLCDIFSYGLVLGQALGRWGNFFNSEAFGAPTNSFLKLFIPLANRPFGFEEYEYFHPTFLYESVLDICIFFVLFFVVRKVAKGEDKDGVVFFSYLLLYSIVRIIIERIRIDSVLNIGGVPIAEIISLFAIIVSIGFLLRICRK